METIKDLLNRIKWDKQLNPDEYVIEYLDHTSVNLKELRYVDILRLEGNFMIIKQDDKEIEIPMHRIRKIKRNNKLVWERK